MPFFDIVSEFDKHEMRNAVDQANRELTTRYDFRGVEAAFELTDNSIIVSAQEEFQLEQMFLMLTTAMSKRKVDLKSLADPVDSKAGKAVKRSYGLKQGIDQKTAKSLVKKIKERKLKVQASVQGDQVRVTGKKRDDLQQVIQMVKDDDTLELALQFTNFRD